MTKRELKMITKNSIKLTLSDWVGTLIAKENITRILKEYM